MSLCFLYVQGFGSLQRQVVDVDFGGIRLDVGWGKQKRFLCLTRMSHEVVGAEAYFTMG